MKNIFKISVLTGLMLAVSACSDFGDTNVDPNNSTVVAPETLISSSLRNVASVVGSSTGVLYSQHFAETQYTDASRYSTVNFDFNGWYTGPLVNLQHVIELNADQVANGSPSDPSTQQAIAQTAVSRILKAYFYHHMTDRWGPLPFNEALQGRDNFRPVYDEQQTVYMSLFSELDAAVDQLNDGEPLRGDFLLGGDLDWWAKFGNSLHAIMAMRLSEVDATTAEAEFVKAYNRGVITTNDESVMYPYLAETNNQNPWFAAFITRTDWAVSDVLVDWMRFPYGSVPGEDMELEDPRLAVYGDPAPNYGYVRGMPYGVEAAGDIPNDEISFPNFPNVRGQDAPIGVITASQMLFTLAEAAHRDWINADAQQLYEDAIAASMEQWGVYDENVFKEFVARPEVAWDDSRAMELIHQQKWVALFLQGYEAWSEWRRTGYPNLQPPPDPLNPSGEIPRRQGYPTSERDLNGPNYEKAVDMLGGPDDLDTPLWWDK